MHAILTCLWIACDACGIPKLIFFCFNTSKCTLKNFYLDTLCPMSCNCSRCLQKWKVIIYIFYTRVRKQYQQLVSNWEGMGLAKLCDPCIRFIQWGLAPAWPCLVSGGCHCLVVSNPMKWKIDNKGFQLLLSLPQLLGCCSDDRIHSCPTQIHKVTVISGTQNLGGVYAVMGKQMTKKNCLSIAAVLF